MKKGGFSNKQLKKVWLVTVFTILCSLFALATLAAAQSSGIAVVSTRAQWDAAFSNARAGSIDVIRIAPGSIIDITHANPWRIPADVRIEGDAESTVLVTRAAWENHNWNALQTDGPGVVISGIILRGPLTGTCSWPTPSGSYIACDPPPVNDLWYSSGVGLSHVDSVVEFSDISGFIHHGVAATPGTRVYANHIHHNGRRSRAQRGDMGYGVVVYGYTNDDLPLIDYNLFSHHRHAIATPGKPADSRGPGSSYKAAYNRVVGPNRGHVFDVHGWNEGSTRHHLPNDAGDTFILRGNVVIENDFPAFSFRGTPSGSALVAENCFTRHAYWGVQEFPVYQNGVEISRDKIWDSGPMQNIKLSPRNQGGCRLPTEARCAGRAATIIGTEGNDILYGTAGPDVIAGLGGKDVIMGLGGNDIICGGDGHDTILGGSGNDNLHGDAGNDNVDGGPGNDQVRGEAGNDRLYGGDGDDQMHGHSGKDYMRGGNGNDIIRGNEDDDNLHGDAGNDNVDGGGGNDQVRGEAGNDALYGDDGDDQMHGHSGKDYMRGGRGNDLIRGNEDDDNLHGDAGNDNVDGGPGNDQVRGEAGHDRLFGGDGNDQMHGHSGNDYMRGGNGDDLIRGNEDDDNLHGDAGNDNVDGGPGDDQVRGEAGNDRLFGGDGNDQMHGHGGRDYMRGGNGNDIIRGNDHDDNLHGDAGNDNVDGGGGNDQVRGEAGHDTLSGGDGNDQMHGHDGNDTMHGGRGNDIIRGNNGDDNLYGDAGRDDLNGGAGNDSIDGRAEQAATSGGGTSQMQASSASSAGGSNQLQAALVSAAASSMQGLSRMYPGIYYGTAFHSNAHVVKVDLREPGISFHASGPPNNGKTTSRYAREAGMSVAVNGDWFEGRTPVGHAKTDGNLWHWEFDPVWKAFGCNSRSECFLEPDVNNDAIRNVVGGNVQLLIRNGVVQTTHMSHTDRPTYYYHKRRTAIGLDATGRTLILLAVHSRSENFHSMALKMQALGAHNALMLDGGGSTSMVVGGVSRVPSSRPVANHVGIRHRTPSDDQRPVDIAVVNNSGARYVVYASGRLSALGGARHRGDLSHISLAKPIVGMALTPSKNGYWMVASDGGIFAFGDARFYGSMGGHHLNKPVVGMAATPTGRGYWLVASDGGIFAFGDAGFFGSMGGHRLNQPVVGIAATPTGRGYWMVASDGGIFAFGDAQFYGSMGGTPLNEPVVDFMPSPSGRGYLMVAKDGGMFAFGDAQFYGIGNERQFSTAAAIAPNGRHYYILDARGGTICRGTCP